MSRICEDFTTSTLDRDALAQALVAVGGLLDSRPEILEVDLNPVRVYERGLLALDALVICKS